MLKSKINELIETSDIILEILEPNSIEKTRNKFFENKIFEEKKDLILVVNKIDLLENKKQEISVIKKRIKQEIKEPLTLFFVSAKTGLGITELKRHLIKKYKEKNEKKDKIVIGLIGYPNTGKSSLINSLSKGAKTKTSSTSGFTKGLQLIKVSRNKNLYLLDSPGIINPKQRDEFELSTMNAKDINKIKDPEGVALELIKENTQRIINHYNIKIEEKKDDETGQEEQILEEIGKKLNYLKQKNQIDKIRTAKKIIKDWQENKIKTTKKQK